MEVHQERYQGWSQAAIDAFEKICSNEHGRELSCGICYEPYLKPIELPCQHVFCQSCLQSVVEYQDNHCPMCRKTLPAQGQWKASRIIARQVEIAAKEVLEQHSNDQALRTSITSQYAVEEPRLSCEQHGESRANQGEGVLDLTRDNRKEIIGDSTVQVIRGGPRLESVIQLSQLRVLDLRGGVRDLPRLTDLPNLEELRATRCELPLRNLPYEQLKLLQFEQAPAITEIDHLDNLETLIGWPELEEVRNLPQLTHLELSACKIRSIVNLPRLEVLQAHREEWEQTVKKRVAHCNPKVFRTMLVAGGILLLPVFLIGVAPLKVACSSRHLSTSAHLYHRFKPWSLHLAKLPQLKQLDLAGIRLKECSLNDFPRLERARLALAGAYTTMPPPILYSREGKVREVTQTVEASALSMEIKPHPSLKSLVLEGVQVKSIRHMPELETLELRGIQFLAPGRGSLPDSNRLVVETRVSVVADTPKLHTLRRDHAQVGSANIPDAIEPAPVERAPAQEARPRGVKIEEID